MATTVTWSQDVNGNFEVSSAAHLKQLMHKGNLYTDAGTFPGSYWYSNYIQIVDIDLLGISTDIVPIGTFADPFYGVYDGGNFTISNWSYVDPNFTNEVDCEFYVGMFGRIETSLRNIRLDGIWTLEGFKNSAGFLVGCVNSGLNIENIECDFSDGTFIESNDPLLINTGAISGLVTADNITGWTVRGSVDFRTTVEYIGGLAGSITVKVNSSLFRNLATFPSGITGANAAGICGELILAGGATFSKYINAMTGDITGDGDWGNVGGVVAECTLLTAASGEKLINAMTGNISNSNILSSRGVGGIIGDTMIFGPLSNLLNYMTGNIVSPTDLNAGGLVGRYDNREGSEINSSINAMNGNVPNAIIGMVQVTISNVVFSNLHASTGFGLTFTTNTYGVDPIPSGMLTTSEFTDLPYVLLDGTDTIGNMYDFDFVYANLAGNVSFSTTHLIISQGQSIFQDGVVPSPLSVTARPTNMPVTFTEVTGATGYNITYEGPTGGEITAVSGTTTLEHNITGLNPETSYIIRLYADTGAGYVLTEELTQTTLPNSASNYDMTDFQNSSGVTDLTSADEGTLENMSEVINDLLNTGDPVLVSVQGNAELNTFFINLGQTLTIGALSALLLPFVQSAGAGQSVIVTLSDGLTDVTINYDHTLNSVEVNGDVYYPGDSFVLDGRKVSVAEY